MKVIKYTQLFKVSILGFITNKKQTSRFKHLNEVDPSAKKAVVMH